MLEKIITWKKSISMLRMMILWKCLQTCYKRWSPERIYRLVRKDDPLKVVYRHVRKDDPLREVVRHVRKDDPLKDVYRNFREDDLKNFTDLLGKLILWQKFTSIYGKRWSFEISFQIVWKDDPLKEIYRYVKKNHSLNKVILDKDIKVWHF